MGVEKTSMKQFKEEIKNPPGGPQGRANFVQTEDTQRAAAGRFWQPRGKAEKFNHRTKVLTSNDKLAKTTSRVVSAVLGNSTARPSAQKAKKRRH